ncbi:MAG: RlmE family RNA methyltransferase [Rickettsiales bacterium]|nr:RlmE family RNA methyltransferase [Rickettsiales bacterium]MCA0254124.1 RlmE family RNA methyltransferase [Pseudomonadota bacterium]
MSTNKTGFRGQFVKVKTAKRRKTSSTRWLSRQLNDQYVVRSKLDGYRSRAAYKILEINEKFEILKPGYNVIDLGAAPGGWSQVATKLIGSNSKNAKNKLVAIDLLEIEPIAGATLIKMDFNDESAKQTILDILDGKLADVVMSDMAANTIGHGKTDHLRIIALCEDALEFALKVLKPGGHFIAKIFRGGAEGEMLDVVKKNFKIVKHFKPDSSRKESSEFYLIALERKDV